MDINTAPALAEWAGRVTKQAEQLRIIASATNDDEMRDELVEYAGRLDDHARDIRAAKNDNARKLVSRGRSSTN